MSTTITPVAADYPRLVPRTERTASILSVCPFDCSKEMAVGGKLHTFRIPGQERDGYHILKVTDTFQIVQGGFDDLGPNNPIPGMVQAPIYAEDLAKSLVADFSRSRATAGGMGVAVLPEDVAEGSPEFHRLLNVLSAQVQLLAQWAIREAMDLHVKGDGRKIADGFHRRLAQWLYGEAQARALPWYNAANVEAFKKCVACGETINASARVCKTCSTDLVKFYRENPDLDPDMDPVVAAAFARTVQVPKQTERTASTTTAPAPLRVPLEVPPLSDAVRAACVGALSAEQKAQMHARKSQAEKDQFVISVMADLALKNPNLKTLLVEKGYVLPDAD